MSPNNCPFTPFAVTSPAAQHIQNTWRYVVTQMVDLHGGDFRSILYLVSGRLRFISLTRVSVSEELIKVARNLDTLHPETPETPETPENMKALESVRLAA